mmetsp:Transcript_39658/g.51966  ORF Transcript_39658/g.51966 Transcript_39658/m.51966 type:complete len:145 (+) Transcript_39658:142-576(+)
MCYLIQMQMGMFFKQEEFDEAQFCRYYLKLYKKLRNLDRNKMQGLKFSKAFNEFSVLVYHNMFGPNGLQIAADKKKNAQQKQPLSPEALNLQSQSGAINGGVSSMDYGGRGSLSRGKTQPDKDYKRKVTFAGSNGDECSSMGLP